MLNIRNLAGLGRRLKFSPLVKGAPMISQAIRPATKLASLPALKSSAVLFGLVGTKVSLTQCMFDENDDDMVQAFLAAVLPSLGYMVYLGE